MKNLTHLPDLTAVLMSFSALLKPSAEPVDVAETPVQRHHPVPNSRLLLFIADACSFLTNRDGGDLLVFLSGKISDEAAGVVSRHRTHEHWSAGLDLQGKAGHRGFENAHRHTRDKNVSKVILYLAVHNVTQVKRLLDNVHEGFSECL